MTDDQQSPGFSGWNLDSITRAVANVGLPAVIVLVLLWPTYKLLDASGDAVPVNAQAARDTAATLKEMRDDQRALLEMQKTIVETQRAIAEKLSRAGGAP